MLKKWLLTTFLIFLAGCTGINPASDPKSTLIVPVDYKQVYERAQAQAEYCWRGVTNYPIRGQIDEVNRTASVYVTGMMGSSRMAQVDIRAIDGQSSEVSIAVIGLNIWDQAAVKAMREVVQFGVPTCTSYMPHKQ